jgi:hypothetical protein
MSLKLGNPLGVLPPSIMAAPITNHSDTATNSRVTEDLAHSLALLRAADQQLRVHHTDIAIRLLARAEARLASARAGLPGVTDEERFTLQERLNAARETFEDFRVHMCEL